MNIEIPFIEKLTEKNTEVKLPTPTKFIQKRSKSNEHYNLSKLQSNRLKIFEKINSKDHYIRSVSTSAKGIFKKPQNIYKIVPLNNPAIDLSNKLLPRVPMIKIKKIKEYRKYTPSPVFKQRNQENIRKKIKMLDLTISNNKIIV